MEPTFRQSMTWLHTWAGVVLGSVLFAIFLMGMLSLFDREIDRWMVPGARLAAPSGQPLMSLDGAAQIAREYAPDGRQVSAGRACSRIGVPDSRCSITCATHPTLRPSVHNAEALRRGSPSACVTATRPMPSDGARPASVCADLTSECSFEFVDSDLASRNRYNARGSPDG